jgi:hypothetical protein
VSGSNLLVNLVTARATTRVTLVSHRNLNSGLAHAMLRDYYFGGDRCCAILWL